MHFIMRTESSLCELLKFRITVPYHHYISRNGAPEESVSSSKEFPIAAL